MLTPLYTAVYEPAPVKENQIAAQPRSNNQKNTGELTPKASKNNDSEVDESLVGYTLSGVVYHDMNADGIRVEGEPGIGSVRVCRRNPSGFVCTPTGLSLIHI